MRYSRRRARLGLDRQRLSAVSHPELNLGAFSAQERSLRRRRIGRAAARRIHAERVMRVPTRTSGARVPTRVRAVGVTRARAAACAMLASGAPPAIVPGLGALAPSYDAVLLDQFGVRAYCPKAPRHTSVPDGPSPLHDARRVRVPAGVARRHARAPRRCTLLREVGRRGRAPDHSEQHVVSQASRGGQAPLTRLRPVASHRWHPLFGRTRLGAHASRWGRRLARTRARIAPPTPLTPRRGVHAHAQ